MTHAIVTGASGFVGHHVLRHLLENTDWTIAAPVTFTHRGLPRRIQLAVAGIPDWDQRLDVVCCELGTTAQDRIALHDLGVGKAEVILNLASDSHVDRSLMNPVPFIQNNVNVMLGVLEIARECPNLKALLQISTDEVYGPAPAGYLSREWDPIIPSSPYAASKACQEADCVSWWRSYGLPLILTNTMNIIGEAQDREKFVPGTIAKLAHGEPVIIHGKPRDDGTWQIGSRFYLHARNQADALLFLARRALEAGLDWTLMQLPGHGEHEIESLRYGMGGARPLRFNIVGEKELDNLAVAKLIAQHLMSRGDITLQADWFQLQDFHSSRPGHDLRYALDGRKLATLGWEPPVPLEASLRTTVDWTMEHPEWLL